MNSALEVKEDGQIWLNDGRQSILVSDQEVARELLFLKHCIFPKEIALKEVAGIYPIPDLKWEVMTWSKTVGFKESKFQPGFLPVVDHQKVAVISLPEPDKEQRKNLLIEMMQEDEKNGMYDEPKSESPLGEQESQEELWTDFWRYMTLHGDFANPQNHFIITRKSDKQ